MCPKYTHTVKKQMESPRTAWLVAGVVVAVVLIYYASQAHKSGPSEKARGSPPLNKRMFERQPPPMQSRRQPPKTSSGGDDEPPAATRVVNQHDRTADYVDPLFTTLADLHLR